MVLYRVGGEVKPLGDFLIAQAFRNQFDNLPFTRGHPHVGQMSPGGCRWTIGDRGEERSR